MKKGNSFCKFLDHHVNHVKNNSTVLNSSQIKHTEGKKKEDISPRKSNLNFRKPSKGRTIIKKKHYSDISQVL